MNEEMIRYGRKQWAIATNVTRKQERRKARVERRKLERMIRELKKSRGRNKWGWKNRLMSVQTAIMIALSVIVLKVIEILPLIQLRQ